MSSSVAVFGNDDDDACVSENSVVVFSKGKDAVKPSCTVQYSCVKRLRERRLLSFLEDQGFHGAFRELTRETAALFDLERMRRLVGRGRWYDALFYLSTFLPPLKSKRRSHRARIFHNFLNYSILAPDAGQLRAAIDWDRVRSHAEFVVHRMALSTPELRRPMLLPSRCMMPHDVLPIGTGLFRKRHVKKQGPQPPKTEAILMALKHQQYCKQFRDSSVGSKDEALELLVNFLDETLQAGLPRGCKLTYDRQPTGKEGASDALPSAQTMLGTSTDNVKVHAISLVKIPGTQICQIIYDKISGIYTQTNAGTKHLIQAASHAENKMYGPSTVEDDICSKSGSNSW